MVKSSVPIGDYFYQKSLAWFPTFISNYEFLFRLRREGFEFIAARPDLVTPEVIDELPEHLKQEILGLHSWVRPQAFAKKSATDAEEGLLLDSDQESGEPEFNIFS